MSDVFFTLSKPIARKQYNCDACRFILEAWCKADIETLTEDEQIAYQLAKSHNFKILPGERYIKQPQIYDGRFTTFRGIPNMNAICHKYKLYLD